LDSASLNGFVSRDLFDSDHFFRGQTRGKVDSFASGCFTITAATERMKEVDRERKVMWDHLDKMKKALLKLLQKSGFDVSQEDL
jgi:hypothetical protein